jgi:eukaryotic-like serine/threonine-protein kinase
VLERLGAGASPFNEPTKMQQDVPATAQGSPTVSSHVRPQPTVHHEPVPGDLIADKYRLLRKAGEGGMASVWVASNTTLQVDVALKLIRADVRSRSATERLLCEARATASLDHPAIVRVFDLGVTPWCEPFIVMDLLEGESLRELLERVVSLPQVQAVQTFLPLIEGLAAAHERGIIHRDFKPDNVFLASNDSGRVQPKVVDFGIAKVTETHRGAHPLSVAGRLVGSPEYMSPEQARGLAIDGRSDVWAVCVTLYEALAGQRPFVGATATAVLTAVILHEPARLDDPGGVDAALWAILARGLRKEPGERQGSMRELGRELARWLACQGTTVDACGTSLDATWLGGELPPRDEAVSLRRSSLPTLEGPVFTPIPMPSPFGHATPVGSWLASFPIDEQARGPSGSRAGRTSRPLLAALAASLLFLGGSTLAGTALAPPAARVAPALVSIADRTRPEERPAGAEFRPPLAPLAPLAGSAAPAPPAPPVPPALPSASTPRDAAHAGRAPSTRHADPPRAAAARPTARPAERLPRVWSPLSPRPR